jgi:CYTH domain-containing protein
MPNIDVLKACDGIRIKHIEQTYLTSEDNKNARVRRICEKGSIKFVKTVKERISRPSAYEEEYEISENDYNNELKKKDDAKNTIVKTRYCLPFDSHIVEIDVYPFWDDRAILEVELQSEYECFSLPDFIEIIREVSDDGRYKNTRLAQSVPYDEI